MALLLIAIFALVITPAVELECIKVVGDSDIIAKVEKGEPIDCTYVMAKANLDPSELGMSIARYMAFPIKIIDSIFSSFININYILDELVNFKGTEFIGPTSLMESQLRNADFGRAQYEELLIQNLK